MSNPIIDNRIVVDKTYAIRAIRALRFALSVEVCDACGEDERDSMIRYATDLLEYQLKTATSQSEIDYLARCNANELLIKGKMVV